MSDTFEERAYELRAWATSRIEWCRKEELKFGSGKISIEAATERRALQSALAILFPVCGKRCDHGSECLMKPGHRGGHETEHGCVFYDPRAQP